MQNRLQLLNTVTRSDDELDITENITCVWNLPMTALGSVPKAHTQGEPEGTWNLEKLHLELKYLGRKLAEAKLQRQR